MLNHGLHFTEILGMRDSPASNFAPWCIHTITYEACIPGVSGYRRVVTNVIAGPRDSSLIYV